jgi:Rrf2 family protein
MWTRKERAALVTMVDLALHGKSAPVQARAIARRNGLTQPFVEQVLFDLRKARLVEGQRGPKGGLRLSRSADEIPLHDVVAAVARTRKQPALAHGVAGHCELALFEAFRARQDALRAMTLATLAERARLSAGEVEGDFVI